MALSSDLISQFVKITNDETKIEEIKTSYGKIVKQGDKEYVQLDGSDLLTPIETTTVTKDGDRVLVTIKDHTATVMGDLTNPSASDSDVKDIGNTINEFEIIMAGKVVTEDLEAINAYIENIKGVTAKYEELTAITAEIETLQAKYADMEYITAKDAEIINAEIETLRGKLAEFTSISTEDLEAINAEFTNIVAYNATFSYVSADKLSVIDANIKNLETNKLDAETANIKYATIDFSNIGEAAIEKLFSDSGIIKDLIMSEGKVTGELVGVTIKGDLIEGNTVKADKLVIQGEDGLYYKLNVNALGETTASSDEKYQNGLDGSVIVADSITAEKIAVDDLVAFGATIGGFHITDNSLYSGVKESVSNTTQGIYLDNDGQMNVGDSNNFLKFYVDENGEYKLEIQASSIRFGASNSTIEEVINDNVENLVVSAEVEYYLSISMNEPIGGTWETTAPDEVEGKYVWSRTKNTLQNGTITYIPSENGVYVASFEAPDSTNTAEGTELVIDDGIKVLEFRIDGESKQDATPTKETPAVIESVGYVNLCEYTSVYGYVDSEGTIVFDDTNTTYLSTSDVIPVKPNTTYVITFVGYEDGFLYVGEYDENQNYISTIKRTYSGFRTFTTSSTTYYILPHIYNNGLTFTTTGTNIQLEEGVIAHSYVPYGKYGFEISHRGKNLINIPEEIETITNGRLYDMADIIGGKTYTLSISQTLTAASTDGTNQIRHRYSFYNSDNVTSSSKYFCEFNFTEVGETLTDSITITAPDNAVKLIVYAAYSNSSSARCTAITHYVQLEEGSEATEVEPYFSNKASFVLDEPLRSLPNGLKDTAYVKNNTLYVDRYIGSITLDGSEDWKSYLSDSTAPDYLICHLDSDYLNNNYKEYTPDDPNGLCTHFEMIDSQTGIAGEFVELMYDEDGTPYGLKMKVATVDISDVTSLKTWLSENNVEVQYELLTPVSEELDELSVPMEDQYVDIYCVNAHVHPNIFCKYYTEYAASVKDLEDTMEEILDETVDDINKLIVDQRTEIIAETEALILKAATNYVGTGDYEALKETIEAELSVMSDNITMNFTTTSNAISDLENSTSESIAKINKYFQFDEDGMTIGGSESSIKLTIDNEDGIIFSKNDEPFGYWDGNDFYTGNIVVRVNERAQFGDYAYIPRSDGSLMFLKVK